ncbi:MAG: hypothetical protein SGJ23_13875 [Alphaproteobacteria bacterium]|nr:hypothetical protein [Alphaproteobacteria bacterium]
MLLKVMTAALAIGATGGASIALAQNVMGANDARYAEASVRESKLGETCEPVAFRIYFEPGSAQLNGEAKDTIDTATRQVSGCANVDLALAADPGQIADTSQRRNVVASRSAAWLSSRKCVATACRAKSTFRTSATRWSRPN